MTPNNVKGDAKFAEVIRQTYHGIRFAHVMAQNTPKKDKDYISAEIAPLYRKNMNMEFEEMITDLAKKTAPICKRPTLFSDVGETDIDPSTLTDEMTKLFTKQARLYAIAMNEIAPVIYDQYRKNKDEIALRRAVREKIKEVPLTNYAQYVPLNLITHTVQLKEEQEAERKRQEEEKARIYNEMAIHFFS